MNLPTTEARSTPAVARNVKKNRTPPTVNYLIVSNSADTMMYSKDQRSSRMEKKNGL